MRIQGGPKLGKAFGARIAHGRPFHAGSPWKYFASIHHFGGPLVKRAICFLLQQTSPIIEMRNCKPEDKVCEKRPFLLSGAPFCIALPSTHIEFLVGSQNEIARFFRNARGVLGASHAGPRLPAACMARMRAFHLP
jgi:hypothetical protein